jgi:CHAT domain-containing protein
MLHEAREVALAVENPTLLLGEAATHAAVNELAPDSSLVHIATHGLFRRDNPMFSSVRLADSYLSLYDLYRLPLQADLFALSGCGTGLSVVAAGDEIMGLARGLLYAGGQLTSADAMGCARPKYRFVYAIFLHASATR